MILTSTGITTIDQQIAEWFNSNFGKGGEWNYGNLILCFIAVLLSIILCGVIGLEREKKGRSAGLRTHLLVGVGSCIVMIISIYGFPAWNLDNRDVARLAAGIIAGVGFLGAGAIIHFNGGIKGLTTAGTIWLSMAIGIACGSMNFILAVGATIVVLFVLIVFKKVENNISKKAPLIMVIAKLDNNITSKILTIAKDMSLSVSDFSSQIIDVKGEPHIECIFKVSNSDGSNVDISCFIKTIQDSGIIDSVEVLGHYRKEEK